jgi:molybdopterin molybdotransferase
MQEHAVRDPGGDRVVIDQPVRAGQNRLEQGRELKRGTSILATGTRIGPIQIGILASTGHGEVPVFPRPRISILSTGDELRPPGEPGISLAPGQIWDSNGPMLEQLARSQGFQVVHRSLASDEATELRPRIEEALRPGGQAIDLLILTGGVSVGDRDLVPGMLMELGVQPVFHKLKLKPGKPLWFGVQPGRLGESSARAQGTLVFGLPGNPVSVLVGFLLFVAPAGRALGGEPFEPPRTVPARLGRAFVHRGDRPTYHPARLALGDATEPPVVEPLEWAGSPDLFTLTHANGFVVFPAGDRKHDTGELVEFLPLP